MLWWYSTMYKNRTRERESFVQDIYILLCYSTRVRTIIASAAVRENKVYLINSSKDKIRAFLKSSIYLKLRYKLLNTCIWSNVFTLTDKTTEWIWNLRNWMLKKFNCLYICKTDKSLTSIKRGKKNYLKIKKPGWFQHLNSYPHVLNSNWIPDNKASE